MAVAARQWWADPWAESDPTRVPTRFTDFQRAILDTPYHYTIARSGNGVGKSVVLAEMARRGLAGELQWMRPGPQTVIIAGNTWTQLGPTLRCLFDGIPRGWFRSGVRYESGGLKGQRLAVYDLVGGPGQGGELRCGTFRAENLAGPRASLVLTDEPIPQDVHNELWPRLLGRGGRMVSTFTTTIKTAEKLDYIWEMVDDPDRPWAGEIHTELCLEAVTPRGGLVEIPWMTRDEIERFEQGLSRIEADMRMGRTRRPALTEVYFSAWSQELRVAWHPPDGTIIAVGIDHGSKPGAQRASLVLVSMIGPQPRIHVLDHYRGDGRTESEDDARGILEMLRRNAGLLGVTDRQDRSLLAAVDYWVGDRAHAGSKWGGVKSNVRLQEAIAQAVGIDTRRRRPRWLAELPEALRGMRKPRKYDGSVWDEVDLLHRAMVGCRFTIDPRSECDALDEDFSVWQAGRTEPAKDGIDSVRYPVAALVDRDRRVA